MLFFLLELPKVDLMPKTAARTILTFAMRSVSHCIILMIVGRSACASRLARPPHAAFMAVMESVHVSESCISSFDIVPPSSL